MKYLIPTNKIEQLAKLVNKVNKKGANIVFNVGKEKIYTDGILNITDKNGYIFNTISIKVECVEVEIDGIYKINGWEFVGVIEFKNTGNIIRLANSSFNGKIPSNYYHTDKHCDHCNTIKNRKDLYLIYNQETNEFKQVGSSCLLEYTNGMDFSIIGSIMSCLYFVEDNTIYEYTYSNGDFFNNDCFSIHSRNIKALAIALVKANGYNGKDTIDTLKEIIFKNNGKKATNEEIEEIDNYAKTIKAEYGYMQSAKVVWLSNDIQFRDLGLVCSFVSVALKAISKSKNSNILNEHFGNVGDKITIKVSNARVIYVKSNYHCSYFAEPSNVFEIIDQQGYVFIWSTSSYEEIKANSTITATIKSHSEYKGVKQTVITRGKVQEQE